MDGQINSAVNAPLSSTDELMPWRKRSQAEIYLEATRRRRPLTGSVIAVRGLDSVTPVCVVRWKGIHVEIPGREMFPEQWPEGEPAPKEIRTRLRRILGAEVDFLPKALQSHVGQGSRRAAMGIKVKEYFDAGKVKTGNYVACRVVGVGNNRVRAEVFGVETDIETSQLSWDWFVDVRDSFHSGMQMVCLVTDVHRGEDGRWAVTLSRKMAHSRDDRNLKRLIPRSAYIGTVTGFNNGVYFVRLQEGANAKARLCTAHNLPQRGDQVVFMIRSVNVEKHHALGLITHVLHKKTPSSA